MGGWGERRSKFCVGAFKARAGGGGVYETDSGSCMMDIGDVCSEHNGGRIVRRDTTRIQPKPIIISQGLKPGLRLATAATSREKATANLRSPHPIWRISLSSAGIRRHFLARVIIRVVFRQD